jgi:hypothetical protein
MAVRAVLVGIAAQRVPRVRAVRLARSALAASTV